MKAVLWRLGDEQAVVYTEDREVLARLLEVEPFQARTASAFTTYLDSRGRVKAWQTSFAAPQWARVTRFLRRHAVDLEDRSPERPPRPRGAVKAGAAKTVRPGNGVVLPG